MNYKKYTLKNGLRVILVPKKDMPTATVLICVGTGSRYEDAHENGLAHFLEHMFFKGTKKRLNAIDITKELDAIGSSHNAYTGKDRSGYYAKVPASKTLQALDIISDLFLHATFRPKEIKKESGTITQEINMYEDMPSRNVFDIFDTLLYGINHPLGREILGPKENVQSFTQKDILTYKDRCYSAKNTVVCIAGNFPQGKVLAKIRKDFAIMSAEKKPVYEKYSDDQKMPRLVIKNKKTDQTHVIIGVKTAGSDDKQRFALHLLSNILGGGMSSRLWSEIREKRGLAYDVSAGTELYKETGSFLVKAGVEHKNLMTTIEIILKELKKVAKTGVTREELQRAKTGFEGRLSFGYETSSAIASHFAEQEAVKGKIVMPQETLAKIKKVTAKQIQKAAQDIFVDGGINCAIIGPQKENEKKIAKLLTF